MPAALPPRCDNQKRLQTFQMSPGGQSHSQLRSTGLGESSALGGPVPEVCTGLELGRDPGPISCLDFDHKQRGTEGECDLSKITQQYVSGLLAQCSGPALQCFSTGLGGQTVSHSPRARRPPLSFSGFCSAVLTAAAWWHAEQVYPPGSTPTAQLPCSLSHQGFPNPQCSEDVLGVTGNLRFSFPFAEFVVR